MSSLVAKPVFFDRGLYDPPPPFTLQRGPDPELKTFCIASKKMKGLIDLIADIGAFTGDRANARGVAW